MSGAPTEPRSQKPSLGRILRVGGSLLVYTLTLAALAGGVNTELIHDYHQEPVLGWLYYATCLFVFGGSTLGMPVGGPTVLRGGLWVAYFLAPLITTSAVAEALLSLLDARAPERAPLAGHVILIGSDQLTLAYLDTVRTADPQRPILLLDHREDSLLGTPTGPDENGVSRLSGDALKADTLLAAGVERAYRAIAVGNDDLVNLECAWALRAANATLPIAAHVGDLTLLRPVNRLVQEDQWSEGATRFPLIFSTHRMAMLHLYETSLQPYFEDTVDRDRVVIAGFGRLGQTALELLAALAADQLREVVIVDPQAARLFRQFKADVDLEGLAVTIVDGSLDDPATWDEVHRRMGDGEGQPVFLLADADQVVNLRAAMLLRSRSKDTRVFVRCFHRNSFTDSLAAQLGVDVLSVEDVLKNALQNHYEGLTIG